jgi:O-antigen ligase
VIAAALSISIVATSKFNGLSRYKTLLSTDTYTTDQGLTNRLGLWQVVIEFIKERPINGYGYGWKKLAWLVQEKNTDEFWKARPSSAYNYYVEDAQLMYGRINPHNLVLQIAFEIGIAGLVIYIWLWVTVIEKMYKIIRAGLDPDSHRFVLGSIGVIISYAMVNITNAYWQESYGMMIFLFMALILVIHREHHKKEL